MNTPIAQIDTLIVNIYTPVNSYNLLLSQYLFFAPYS